MYSLDMATEHVLTTSQLQVVDCKSRKSSGPPRSKPKTFSGVFPSVAANDAG
jgi:hypothetical protein